jgi:hypothetical protein
MLIYATEVITYGVFDYTGVYNFIAFNINESFKNRNLYVDSNYFLTNDSLKGIERFSDVTSP